MLNFFGGNKDPNDFGVGVIGLQGTGRTHLIDKLTTNIFPKSSKKLSFHEIDYPDKGFGRTDQTAYNNYIGKMKKQHNLSLILLVVPGSFRDKEAVLVFASKYHALSVAVVMTKFDDSLRNINQETKQFTSTEKAEYKAKEQSYVIQTLLQYKNDANIHVFHVSIPCFSMPLKDKWKPFYQDEKMLCDFVTNCVDGNPNMPLQYHSPTHQCINNSAISPDLPDSYDIALVGVTNSGLIVARKALQKMFENISIQKLEYSHENAKFIVGQLENTPSKTNIVIVKDHIDTVLEGILQYLKRSNRKFCIILNTTNGLQAKQSFMEICQVAVDSEHIFALNVEDLEDFNADKNEKDMFLKTLQGLFGKSVNSTKAALKHSLLETSSSKKYLHDIVLFGFNKAHVDPVYEILEHEVGDIKKIEYQQHCHEEEIFHEIESAKLGIIVIPDTFLTTHYKLFEALNNKNLEYLIIADTTKSQRNGTYSIQKAQNTESEWYHRCFTLRRTNETNIDAEFFTLIKKNVEFNGDGKAKAAKIDSQHFCSNLQRF